MMKTVRTLGMVAALTLLAGPTRAQASDPEAARRAEKLFYGGLDALGRHDYQRARDEFEASVALVPRGSALRNLATVDWALGRHADALKHLRAALQMPDLPADMRQRARGDLDAAYAATGHIVVHTDPGATVAIDGVPIDRAAPLEDPVDVEAGVRVVETRLGDRVGRSEVDAKPGVVVSADVFVAAALIPSPGPPASLEAPNVVPSAEASTSRQERSPSFWSPRRAAGMVVAAAGIASLAAGLVYFGVATGDENRAHAAEAGLGPSSCTGAAQPAACRTLSDASSAQWKDAQVSRSLLGLGAIAAAAGGALMFWPEGVRRSGVAITPVMAPNVAGARVAGRF